MATRPPRWCRADPWAMGGSRKRWVRTACSFCPLPQALLASSGRWTRGASWRNWRAGFRICLEAGARPRMARSRAAPSGIADPKRSLWSCLAGSSLARQSWAVARRVLAVSVLLASRSRGGLRRARAKGPPPPDGEHSAPRPRHRGCRARLVGIGDGRSLYMECVGSGSPTVVLEAGFGADTLGLARRAAGGRPDTRDAVPMIARARATASRRRACVTHATRSPTFGGCSPAPASSRRTCWSVTPTAGCWRACSHTCTHLRRRGSSSSTRWAATDDDGSSPSGRGRRRGRSVVSWRPR